MHRISIQNTSHEGKNNSYLITGDENVLIDTGPATEESRNQLRKGLNEHGLDFHDITKIFLTHFHSDHSGLSGEIQQISGADVFINPKDAPFVENNENKWKELREKQLKYFDMWGIPKDKQGELLNRLDNGPNTYGERVKTNPIRHGEKYHINDIELSAMETPGHTSGLTSYILNGYNHLISGDALLPVYTPNVGGADVRVDQPLKQYLKSLEKIIEKDFQKAWPGHRNPITNPTARSKAIINHHEERAWKILNIVQKQGPLDPWSVSSELFGELENIHILHGPGEAYAHLHHLKNSGDLIQKNGKYCLTKSTENQISNWNTSSWQLVG